MTTQDEDFPCGRTWRWPGLLLVILLIQLLAGGAYLGSTSLATHEQLAAERTRGLMTLGHWVVPHLNGEPNLFKPPLPFWLSGAVAELRGGQMDEFSVRLPTLLASLGLTVVIAVLGRRLAGSRVGLLAAFMHALSVTALVWGRRAEVDIQLAFWTALALLAYWLAHERLGPPDEPNVAVSTAPRLRRPRMSGFAWCLAAWLTLAVAALTKGPLPLVQVLIVVLAMSVIERRCPTSTALAALPVGLLLFAACAVPWVLAVQRHYPDVLAVWSSQTLGRISSGDMESGHPKSVFFYLLRVWVLAAPWILPLVGGLWLALRNRVALGIRRRGLAFLLAWGLGTLIFLSLVAGKRVRYAVVAMPPLFILAAAALAYAWRSRESLGRVLTAAVGLHMVIVPGAAVGAIVMGLLLPVPAAALAAVALVVIVSMLLAWRAYRRQRPVAALAWVGAMVALGMPVVSGAIAPALDDLSNNTGELIGRYLHEHAIDLDRACFYRSSNIGVVFYAGGPIARFDEPEQLAAWLSGRPAAWVIVKDDRGLDEIRSLARSESVDYFRGDLRPRRPRYHLHRLSPLED